MGPKEGKCVSGVCQQGDGSQGMTEIKLCKMNMEKVAQGFFGVELLQTILKILCLSKGKA